MSKVHSPQEKKRLSYARDHYAKGKHDKGFRHAWPRKRTKASRAYRHALETVARKAQQNAEVDVGSVRRKSVMKWGVRYLKQVVGEKIDKRQRGFGAKSARKLGRLRFEEIRRLIRNPQSAIRNPSSASRSSRDTLS